MATASLVWASEVMKALFQEIRKETATGMFSSFTLQTVFESAGGKGEPETVIVLRLPNGTNARRAFTHREIREMLDRNDYLKSKQVFHELMRDQRND